MKKRAAILFLFMFICPCQTGVAATPDVAASPFHYLALKNDGTVWQWGDNPACPAVACTYPEIESEIPLQVAGLTRVTAIAKSGEHSLALLYDGTVWAWGRNNYHQLGDGSITDRGLPVPVTNLTAVKAIAAGGSHGVALKDDGTVWAWGYNGWGAIGDGTTANRPAPVPVPNLSGIKAIAAYGNHNMALKTDGTVWVWGGSTAGTTPLRVENLSGVIAIAPGGAHYLALRDDGTVWAWGINPYGNWYGQLGDGTSDNNRSTPGQVLNLTGVKAIAAGGDHSMALRDDGTVWAWGYNYAGQLGDGTTATRTIPVAVSGLSGMAVITAGGDHSIALKADGTVWVWGLQRLIDFMQFDVINPPQPLGSDFNVLSLSSCRYALKDAIALLQRAAGMFPPDSSSLCLVDDLNADAGIGLEEAIYVLQVAAEMRIHTPFVR